MLKLQSFGHLMQRTDSLLKSGKDWRQEEKGMKEEEMAAWHHELNRHELEQVLGDSEGQKVWHAAVHWVPESDMTE